MKRALQEQARLAVLVADVCLTLTAGDTLQTILGHCAQSMVQHLGAALVRIWTLAPQQHVLKLQASAGLYTHLDGAYSRVPVGQFTMGWIAQACQPHATNAVIGDPHVSDQAWARRQGLVVFAGHPLVVERRLVGVVVLFARQPLTDATLHAIGSVANAMALGIERRQAGEERERLQEQFRQAQKLEAIGILAGGIAHDFNNILGTILGYAEMALVEGPVDTTLRERLQEILVAGQRAKDLVQHLLAFSRKSTPQRQPQILLQRLGVSDASNRMHARRITSGMTRYWTPHGWCCAANRHGVMPPGSPPSLPWAQLPLPCRQSRPGAASFRVIITPAKSSQSPSTIRQGR